MSWALRKITLESPIAKPLLLRGATNVVEEWVRTITKVIKEAGEQQERQEHKEAEAGQEEDDANTKREARRQDRPDSAPPDSPLAGGGETEQGRGKPRRKGAGQGGSGSQQGKLAI